MSDAQDPNQTVPPKPDYSPEQEAELDRTRMDVPVGSDFNGEVTRSEIYVDTGRDKDFPIQKPAGLIQRLGLSKIIQKVSAAFNTKKKSPVSVKKRSAALSPKLLPYLSIWVAPPGATPRRKLFFYLSRVAVLAATAAVFYLLLSGLTHSFSVNSEYRWILSALVAVAAFLSVVSIFGRLHPSWFLGFPTLILLGLITVHFFLYPSFDPYFFSIGGKAPRYFLNEFWLALLGAQLLFVLFIYPRSRAFKGFFVLLIGYGLAGLWMNRDARIPLEASWAGSGVFAKVPVLFAQPVYLALQVLPVLLILFSAASYFYFRKNFGRRNWSLLNLFLLAGALLLANWILYASRVPSPLTAYLKSPLDVGSGHIQEGDNLFELKTSNHEAFVENDRKARYRIELKALAPAGKAETTRYSVSVRDRDNLPVSFLSKKDFVLSLNGEKFAAWDLKAQKGKTDYELKLTMSQEAPQFDFDRPEPLVLGVSDPLHFSLKPESRSIISYEVIIDGKLHEKKEGIGDERKFAVDLADLSVGRHEVEVTATGVGGETFTRTRVIEISLPQALAVQSPLEGDFFKDQLPVHVEFVSQSADPVTLSFLIDERVVTQKKSPPYHVLIDTRDLPDGAHTLKVTAETPASPESAIPGPVLTDSVSLQKGAPSQVSFVRPALGEYVAWDTPVEIKVEGEAPTKIDLLLGDEVLHTWDAPPYQFNWNSSKLIPAPYYLSARVKVASGAQSSAWIAVSLGEGRLKVVPPGGTGLGSQGLAYPSVLFIVDGSTSMRDGWDGDSKWKWIQRLFGLEGVESRLRSSQVAVFATGVKRSFEYGDCTDSSEIVGRSGFQPRKLVKVLQEKSPKGIHALHSALEAALEKKPAKIVVIADGPDACASRLPSDLSKKLKQSKTPIDVVLFKGVSSGTQKKYEELAKLNAGFVSVVASSKEFEEKVNETLTRNFQAFAGDEMVLSAPIDGLDRPLRQGDYKLKLSADSSISDQIISIKNGLITEIPMDPAEPKAAVEPAPAVPAN